MFGAPAPSRGQRAHRAREPLPPRPLGARGSGIPSPRPWCDYFSPNLLGARGFGASCPAPWPHFLLVEKMGEKRRARGEPLAYPPGCLRLFHLAPSPSETLTKNCCLRISSGRAYVHLVGDPCLSRRSAYPAQQTAWEVAVQRNIGVDVCRLQDPGDSRTVSLAPAL